MLRSRKIYSRSTRCILIARSEIPSRRTLLTLAIESSCDDTCVAILEKQDGGSVTEGRPLLQIHHHEKATSNNLAFKGVHPLEALHSHQEHLAKLVQNALAKLPSSEDNSIAQKESLLHITTNGATKTLRKPDFVTVTRGPGMRSNLNVGLDFAKGLAVAWNRPLVGVNHMQAHALTPRLVRALEETTSGPYQPQFPFLSLLVSGGHTMLIKSESLNNHQGLATTADVAIGDAIDKVARKVLPRHILAKSSSAMYGPALEAFTFPKGGFDYDYRAPRTRAEELERYTSRNGWSLVPPLANSKSGSRSKDMEFSFSGLCSSVERIVNNDANALFAKEEDHSKRREISKQLMRLAFEHLATRIKFALEYIHDQETGDIDTIVVSGGVASNGYLRHILRQYLNNRGYGAVRLVFPPVHLCVDNAIMIGWAGIEMFEQGWQSDLSIRSSRKWSLDTRAEDGGILGASGWIRSQKCQGVS